ncbi:hypothetical protein [Thalassolituus hydrocarboniclasticus]|uniref:Uncharacterized protein n=1 Tax=Thalassolituus hydrocarboniclasticus TaxID=2742796 RepID=A0ABY6AAJ9_9GAMM|nr:hypothetical protein [Thalassolituus hydrocarboniclasticus]UXD87618.1 hypothetical protein HUF19_09300 [Thalassolituus hydrocarboniclasticus]
MNRFFLSALLPLSLILPASILISASAQAEITEIPPEEMTEAYIKDTTVIVRRQPAAQKAENGQGDTSLRVSPLDKPYSESDQLKGGTEVPSQIADQYLSEQRDNALLSQSTYDFQTPTLDPQQALREEYLRDVLGLEPGTPIDYNNLQFPTTITPDNPPPAGLGYVIAPGQFSISIPNSDNINAQTHQTPGGEYQVEVTPSEIIFTINLPQQ